MQATDSRHNRLLAALPEADRAALCANAEAIELPLGFPLEDAGEPIGRVYLPLAGIVSVVMVRGSHRVEAGLIGPEGATGLAVTLGATSTPLESVVQAAGRALALPSGRFRKLVDERPALREQMLLFALEFHLQLAETALSNARGRIEERLARWLLMMHDRVGASTLNLTHEFLSQMLGVRRPGVTTAVHALEELRLVRSQRGRIVLLDRDGLIRHAAGFYVGPPPSALVPAW